MKVSPLVCNLFTNFNNEDLINIFDIKIKPIADA